MKSRVTGMNRSGLSETAKCVSSTVDWLLIRGVETSPSLNECIGVLGVHRGSVSTETKNNWNEAILWTDLKGLPCL